MPIAAVINGVHHAVHADHLNTPRRLSDSTGQTRWQWPYSGFGEINPQSTPASGQTAINYSLRYPGQVDDGNGLFYNWNRFYDPRVGRYTNADPIGLDGGWNRFGYVGGNPLRFMDSDGQNPVDPVQRHLLGHASRGNWSEVQHTLQTLTSLTEREAADLLRQCASKRGGQLLKEMKNAGVGTGARSGQHGAPFSRAGAELRREANEVSDPALRDVLRTQAERLIQQGRGINH
jgi:RHS repeat-associated protein